MTRVVKRTEILIFGERSRKTENKIRSLIPQQCIDAVKEKLGADAAKRVEASMKAMDKNGLDFVQLRFGEGDNERRIRIQQEEIA